MSEPAIWLQRRAFWRSTSLISWPASQVSRTLWKRVSAVIDGTSSSSSSSHSSEPATDDPASAFLAP